MVTTATWSGGRIREDARELSSLGRFDVVVCGGGTSGTAAAVSAARAGASTLLVERYGFLGGLLTAWTAEPIMTFHDPAGRAVVGGFWQELLERLVKMGGSPGPLRAEGRPPWGRSSRLTPIDTEITKIALDQLVEEAGVRVVLHALVTGPVMEGDRVRGALLETRSGRLAVEGKVVVDATADGDVCVGAGVTMQKGRESDGRMMPATNHFKVVGVDTSALRRHVESHPDAFRWWSVLDADRELPAGVETRYVACSGFHEEIAAAVGRGELYLGRETINALPVPRPGQMELNTTRVSGVDGTDPADVTRAEMDTRKQALSVMDFARRAVPGFERAQLLQLAVGAQLRETRRLVGEYVLSKEDVVEGRKHEDVIAKGAYPIDIHDPVGSTSTWMELRDSYDVPFRCLLPREARHLVVSGRLTSSVHEAYASLRATPTPFATGQAAGVAAAMAAREEGDVRDVSVGGLQEELRRQGAILALPAPGTAGRG
jgi:hypothetical protein